ncbi:MAG: hypothetical protein IPJ65_13470 [Archangiaceae bacterium]|nr:hypothetical protein [Archangiaceae bacterium]
MGALMVLAAGAALGHPQGFHERVSLAVSLKNVDGLVVVDVDGGERAKLIRAGADLNHDGLISGEERPLLQKKLLQLALQGLKVRVSGYPLVLSATDVKLSTRDDHTVSETGLSLAVLVAASVPSPISDGMKLEVEAVSADRSHVLVEVSATSAADGSVVALERHEVQPDEKWAVALRGLGAREPRIGASAPADGGRRSR